MPDSPKNKKITTLTLALQEAERHRHHRIQTTTEQYLIALADEVIRLNGEIGRVLVAMRNEDKSLPTWRQIQDRIERYQGRVSDLEAENAKLRDRWDLRSQILYGK